VLVLVAAVGFTAALAASGRRRAALLEMRFLERREVELLRLALEAQALRDFRAGRSFPRTYLLGDLRAEVRLSPEGRRLDLNRVSLEDLYQGLVEAGVPQDLASALVRGVERCREDHRRLASLSDPVRLGLVDPYRYWIAPGLYRLVTVFPPQALRLELTLRYRGRTYRFLSVLRPPEPLFRTTL